MSASVLFVWQLMSCGYHLPQMMVPDVEVLVVISSAMRSATWLLTPAASMGAHDTDYAPANV